MVHRSTDARLLTNLLSHDKELSKQFCAFLDAASASVSSLSAYAAASAPPASNIILKVSGSLASADDALRRYADSIDEWREQLKALKTLEDEVTNIIRDREILVTRVLKASRHKQSTGNLQRAKQHPSTSSLDTSRSDFSTKGSLAGHSKLSHTQSELQACETHLAAKERELTIRRCAIVKTGLDARFRAMVECGWAWGEIGKEALGTLEQLTELIDGQSGRPNLTIVNSGTNVRPSSDLSSVSPSQSASQINLPPPPPAPKSILGTFHPSASEPVAVGQLSRSQSPGSREERRLSDAIHTTMNIPPAHAIGDMDMHVAVLLPSPPPSNASHDVSPIRSASSVSIKSLPQSENGLPRSYITEEQSYGMRRHVLSRRITEEEFDETYHNIFSSRHENDSGSEDDHNGDNLTAVDNPRFVKGKKGRQYHTEKPPLKREQRKSLFGSLRGFFGHHPKNETIDEHPSANGGLTGLFGGKKNKWDIRTERNLRKMDMEDDKQLRGVAKLNSPPGSTEKPRRASGAPSSRGSLRFVNGNVVADRDTVIAESDNESRRRKLTRGRRGTGPLTRKRSSSMPPASTTTSPSRYAEDAEVKQRLVSVTAPPAQTTSRPPPPAGTLSRSSSIMTAASAPVVSKTARTKLATNSTQIERRASLGNKLMAGRRDGSGSERAAGHVRSGSNPVGLSDGRKGILHFTPTNGATASTSLMSIVEDVARANRNATQKLRDKKSLSMANLLPEQPVPGENATSPGSSTLTLRPSPGNSTSSHVATVSPSGPSEPVIYIPKAPQSLGRRELEAWDREGGMKTRLKGSAHVTASSTSSSTSTPEKQREGRALAATSSPGAGSAVPGRRPAQLPLRSALRNPNSRSGSPAPMAGPSHNGSPAENGLILASATLATPGEPNDQAGKKGHDNDDAASVSSYETGREVPLEDAVAAPGPGPMTKDAIDSTLKGSASQAVDKKHDVHAEARDVSPPPDSVQSSTGTPQRRKSVRVSLQPTFSPSPPAIYVDYEEQERNGIVPLRSGKQADQEDGATINERLSKKRNEDIPRDFWENSSDEDEEYTNAKRLLSRLSTVSRKG